MAGSLAEQIDVAIIGAGGAGYPAAFLLARAGLQVVMVDPFGNLGGDCLAEGCVPSKAVREAALSYHRSRQGRLSALAPPGAGANADRSLAEGAWRLALERKDAVQQARYDQHTAEIQSSGFRFVTGRARVVDDDELEVHAQLGERANFRFRHLVLATGSAPSALAVPGADLAVTSHDLFRLGADIELPARPVIIGGGYIGMEVASMLEHLGAAPVVLELTDQLLPGFDPELSEFLKRSVEGRVQVKLGKAVTSIERRGTGYLVHFQERTGPPPPPEGAGGQEGSVQGDLVVMATGRVPVLPEGAEHLGIDLHGHAPVVDACLRTSRRSVWAPGDVNTKSMLFHSAMRQSTVVAHNILAGGVNADRMDFSSVPTTVFTDPELASVGLSQAQAAERYAEVAIGSYDYASDARAQIFGETNGFIKLVFDAHSGKLLGAQVGGLDAAQVVAPLALALTARLGARALAEAAFPHPMISEGINKAARQVLV